MSYFSDEDRAVRESVGECTEAPDHDTHWVDDERGYCRACGAEFEFEVAERPYPVVQ